MNAGITVQNSSNECDSSIITFTFLFTAVLNKLNPTIEIIKIKIVIAWLWKKISCSISGEAAFCSISADQVDISKKEYSLIDEF